MDTEKAQQGFRILNWIGIIEQLSRNRANKAIGETGLPWPQFILLNHFSHRPQEGKRVTDVARAMQQQQPGVTKTMAAMVKSGLLRIDRDDADGRAKIHYVTEKGLTARQDAIALLLPMIDAAFAGWDTEEMTDLFQTLDRLKIFMDENR